MLVIDIHATDVRSEIRECLKLDQDDKKCHDHYKKVKKVVKALDNSQEHLDREDFEACSRSAKRVMFQFLFQYNSEGDRFKAASAVSRRKKSTSNMPVRIGSVVFFLNIDCPVSC